LTVQLSRNGLFEVRSVVLKRRIVDVICSGAAFQSGSHRNMERAGMRMQFVRSIWTEPK